jgi:hypothetical protein
VANGVIGEAKLAGNRDKNFASLKMQQEKLNSLE